MPVKLIVAARDWESKEVKCTFTVQADEANLVAKDRSKQIYELPAGTKEVTIVATPQTKIHWETTVALVVSSDGTFSPKAKLEAWISLTPATGATMDTTLATVRVSQFKEVTHHVWQLLRDVPGEAGKPRHGLAPTQPELAATYGTWPPDDLDIHPLPGAHYLDVDTPVKAGGILNFTKDGSVNVDSESVVLELKGVRGPRLFGVVWPKAVPRDKGAAPTQFLFYIRQTGGQDRKNVFVGGAVKGPYPYNFDYAERCLFESQHYPPTPIFERKGWMLRPKGVPYQVAKSGANVVMVFPVADSDDSISYEALSNFDEMGRLLADLQAFMFWRVGIAAPPSTVGKTVLSAFSSATDTLAKWLNSNGASAFLRNNISAVYFLDPPRVDDCVTAGLNWRRRMGKDKRVRLYSAKDRDENTEKLHVPAYRRLLGLQPTDPLSPPFLLGAADNKITMAWFPTDSWDRTFKDLGVNVTFKWEYWDAHHLVPATVLPHALSQKDIDSGPARPQQKKAEWSRGEKIALWSLLVVVAGVIIVLAFS